MRNFDNFNLITNLSIESSRSQRLSVRMKFACENFALMSAQEHDGSGQGRSSRRSLSMCGIGVGNDD